MQAPERRKSVLARTPERTAHTHTALPSGGGKCSDAAPAPQWSVIIWRSFFPFFFWYFFYSCPAFASLPALLSEHRALRPRQCTFTALHGEPYNAGSQWGCVSQRERKFNSFASVVELHRRALGRWTLDCVCVKFEAHKFTDKTLSRTSCSSAAFSLSLCL